VQARFVSQDRGGARRSIDRHRRGGDAPLAAPRISPRGTRWDIMLRRMNVSDWPHGPLDSSSGGSVIMAYRGMIALALLLWAAGSASGAERLRFWNLTSVTLKELYLAPAGTTQWSANQCKNDKDGTVDHDERLTITGITPGQYDVKLADKKGRVCTVQNVEVASGRPYAFSLSDKDLTNCTK
jgi:hypothetical protein